jgi:hypothetical protein
MKRGELSMYRAYTPAAAESALAGVQLELAKERQRLTIAEAQCATALQRVAALEASTSWRITAPLRALAHAFRSTRAAAPKQRESTVAMDPAKSEAAIEYVSDDEFRLGDFKFSLAQQGETTRDRIVLVKDRLFIESYRQTLVPLAPRRMFEFGLFQGGSAIFLTSLLQLDKYVCVDIRDRLEGFEGILSSHPIGARIKTYYNTAQDDDVAVTKILKEEFANNELDLIIDDASHQYELTKRSFEIAFPFLRKGGCYIIEDWSWAHWPQNQNASEGWGTWTACSNLILELVLLLPSSDLIESITVHQGYVLIRKSHCVTDARPLRIDDMLLLRGRKLNKI